MSAASSQRVRTRLGISDGQQTELIQALDGELKEDTEVVTNVMTGAVRQTPTAPGGSGVPRTWRRTAGLPGRRWRWQPGRWARSVMPVISVRDLIKTYTVGEVKVHALRGVSLDIEPGEFVAATGPSGSGKSTLMHILGCLDHPTSGQYFLDGRDVAKLSRNDLAEVRNHKIGFVFQGFNLLSRTSALDNVELPLLYTDKTMKASERHARAMTALKDVGLGERAHHHPNQLSGGQQQRVAIARALINRPSLILADEPTGNLDSRTSVEVMGIFQRLNAEQGITVLLITHEHDIAEYATRIVAFRDGRIVGNQPVENRRNADTELASMPAVV